MEEKTFKVNFKGYAVGEYLDSIGIGDTSRFKYWIELRAKVGSSIIDISNIDFGNVKCGSTQEKEFIITNQGDIDLKITGYNDYLNQYFTHNLPVINSNNPLILHPGETKQYTITFKPITEGVFRDSIVFISNAEEGDNSVIIGAVAEKEADAVGDELFNTGFSLTPNPAGDYIEIRKPSEGWQPSEGSNIRIYNILGECVMETAIYPITASHRMNIANLPVGIYYLRCGSQAKMFVKE